MRSAVPGGGARGAGPEHRVDHGAPCGVRCLGQRPTGHPRRGNRSSLAEPVAVIRRGGSL